MLTGVLESQSNQKSLHREAQVFATEVRSTEGNAKVGCDPPGQGESIGGVGELDCLLTDRPQVIAHDDAASYSKHEAGLIAGALRTHHPGNQASDQEQRWPAKTSKTHQVLRNWWSTARHRSITTAMPADSSRRATSSSRIPCCIQTSRGCTSSKASRRAAMCSDRRKMFTMSIGPRAAAAVRRSGYTASPRVMPPAGCTGTMR